MSRRKLDTPPVGRAVTKVGGYTIAPPELLQKGDRFIDTDEAAQLLGTSPNTLNYWRVMGTGPRFYRMARNVRYLLSEVIAWGKSRCVDPQRERISA